MHHNLQVVHLQFMHHNFLVVHKKEISHKWYTTCETGGVPQYAAGLPPAAYVQQVVDLLDYCCIGYANAA